MERRLAQVISYCFHPVLIPTLSILVLFSLDTYFSYTINLSGKLAVYAIVLINTALIPVLMAWLQYKQGFIKNLSLADRKERIAPLLLTSVFYFFCFWVLSRNNLPAPVNYSMLGAALAVFLAFIINFFFKISIHLISSGGIIGMLLGIAEKLNAEVTSLLFLFIFIAGLVGFSRLKLDRHRPAEIYTGFMLGFFCVYGALYFGLID